jgi:hypothetical protein
MSTQKSKIAKETFWRTMTTDKDRKAGPIAISHMTPAEIEKEYPNIRLEKKTFIHWTYVKNKGGKMIKAAAIIINGKICTGRRHWEIIRDNPTTEYITQDVQGFITDTGEFVGREEAAEIAFECGQIKEPKKVLFSEDIL